MAKPYVTWSYSALNEFDNCNYKYWRLKIKKDVSDVHGKNAEGDLFHQAVQKYILTGRPLPEPLLPSQSLFDKFRGKPGLAVEQEYALDEQYQPCGYREWDRAWVRAQGDVCIVNGTVGKYIDWKFGKPRKDDDQLALASAVLFQHYPQLQRIDAAYIHPLEIHNFAVIDQSYSREQIPQLWNRFLPKVNKLVIAKQTDEWKKNPNPLCAWCPVLDCQHNTRHENSYFQTSPT